MENLFWKLIQSENKKDPFTDEQLAERLSVSRQIVIRLRKKCNIPSSGKRREPYLKEDIQKLLEEDRTISDRTLTTLLQKKGYNISKYVISAYRRELPELRTRDLPNKKEAEADPYGHLIGRMGSMLPILKKAKAAVCYPPNGLHTLIIGETGTGKTVLAEIMFNIAHEKRQVDKQKYVRFNCADYYNNPQLLVSQLFGHIKGTYTGADTDKPGLVEKADGGILFLDEIHRLPPEGQEILFTIIDKGKYRRLGESGPERSISLMIIGATTENIESNLTLPFIRRIPMIIEMPPLRNRGIDERYEMIKNFFLQEAVRIGVGINVSSEVICALLTYECYGNIGQLLSDIQVACARAYIRYLDKPDKLMAVTLLDFAENVREGLIRRKYSEKALFPYLDKGIRVLPDQAKVWVFDESDTLLMPDEIYKFIEERHRELESDGFTGFEIQEIVGEELDIRLKRTLRSLTRMDTDNSKAELTTIEDQAVVAALDKMYRFMEEQSDPLDKDISYYLAIHFCQSYERIRQNKQIINPRLKQIMQQYPAEYELAKQMLEIAHQELGCQFPDEEAGYIAFYLAQNKVKAPTKSRVQIIVATHGSVGREMAIVTNRLLEIDFVKYVNISLEDKDNQFLKEAVDLSINCNDGQGILFLADMGIAVTLGDQVTKETGIPTKTVPKVHTAMVMDAAFRAIHQNLSLNELFESVIKENPYLIYPKIKNTLKVIIILCMTGKGASRDIKSMLEHNVTEISENQIEIITLGMLSDDHIEEINKIRGHKQIIAAIGTVDPGIKDIPFISMRKAMDQQGLSEIRTLIRLHLQYFASIPQYSAETSLFDLLSEKLFFPRLAICSKQELLHFVAGKMYEYGYVKESYLDGILKRETQGNTGFTNGLALVHTYSDYTLKSTISIVTLQRPIFWEKGFYASIVLFMALKYPNETIVKQIYSLGTRPELCEALINADNVTRLQQIIMNLGGTPQC
jgi:transcriptional regulator with AAA-type ATPase domain/transcriptional regulatory protein LevR